MRNSHRTVFLYSTFCMFVISFGAEVKRDILEYQYSSDLHSNFKNLTLYLEFLDNVFDFLSSSHNISEQCRSESSLLQQKANDGDTNALKTKTLKQPILDSTGKPSSGILEGGVFFIGFYSECVNSNVNISLDKKFSGQYCLVNFNFSADIQEDLPQASWQVTEQSQKLPTIGICIPSSCTTSDLSSAISLSLKENLQKIQVNVDSCHVNPAGFSKDSGAIIVLFILLLVLFSAITATIIDIIQDRNKCLLLASRAAVNNAKTVSREVLCEVTESKNTKRNILLECLLAFSFKRNAKKIFTVEGERENISCIHGLKFLSMALIILGHTYSFGTQNLFFRNPGAAGQAPKDFLSQIFANGTLAVDTFYFISGVLVAYITLKYLEKTGGRFSFVQFYFHRYFRLTPLMMMVVLISAFLIRYLGSGPNWMSVIMPYDAWCKENGYLNALYLHNFINTERMCLSHSWYLATDMQFYLVVPALLIPLHKNVKLGILVSFIFLLVTTVTTAVLTVVNHFPAIPYINTVMDQSIVNSYYKDVYIKPYCRMGPYIIGILVGYLFVHKKELVMKKLTSILLWVLSIISGLSIIYLMWPANLGHLPTDSEAAAYSSLARTFWGACIGWLVVACYYGYGGFVNSILSWTPLVPLSRLTYCAYLIHPVVINMYYGSTEDMVDYSQGFMMYLFIGNLCITFALSTILSLLFESPFVSLEKVILSKRS